MDWKIIEHIVAGLGILSILLHALELGCANAGWTKYQGIFSSIYKFIQGFLGGIKPPTGGQAGAAVCATFLILSANVVQAQTIPDTQTLLQKAGAKSGVIYLWKTNQAVATNNITLYNYKVVDLSGGVARTDGVDLAISVDIAKLNLPINSIPVVSLLNYGNVGLGCVKQSGDKAACGGYASASWKF